MHNVTRLIKKVLFGKTGDTRIQFLRYGAVSVVALGVDFGGMVLLVEVGSVHYVWAATISFIGGLIVNYLLSRLWVFSESKYKSKVTEFALFASIGLVGLLLNDGIIWYLVDKLAMYYIIGKVIATIIVFFWNFGARKILVFGNGTAKEEE